MNGAPLYDRYLSRAFESFRAHNCILDNNEPKKIASYASLTKTVVGNGMNWMHERDEEECSEEANAFLV